jgi:hypothetical protein
MIAGRLAVRRQPVGGGRTAMSDFREKMSVAPYRMDA